MIIVVLENCESITTTALLLFFFFEHFSMKAISSRKIVWERMPGAEKGEGKMY